MDEDEQMAGHRTLTMPPQFRIGQGYDITRSWFTEERLMIAARTIGAAERGLDLARDWAVSREQFGRPIADYQLIQGIQLYAAGGTTTDWMYGDANAKSYTIELRPDRWPGRGRSGFVQPPDQIRPTCDEALAALIG